MACSVMNIGILLSLILSIVVYLIFIKQGKYIGGVVTHGYECAEIAAKILEKGGSAVDAAIAGIFCEGVTMSHTMGLGGGGYMTIYIRKTKTAYFLDFREVAPAAAKKDMFSHNPSLSTEGGLSIAVPSLLKGCWYAHQKFGKLPWATLIQPTINLCRNGFLVTPFLEKFYKKQKCTIENVKSLRDIFINPETNTVYKNGERIKKPVLAQTLETIACEGANALYGGSLTKTFVRDIKQAGGIITEADLKNYTPLWKQPIKIQINDWTMYSSALPGGGVILAFILNILNGFLDHDAGISSVTNWQRTVEAWKFAYARRTEIGDPNYVKNMNELLVNLTSETYAKSIRNRISDTETFNDPHHYGLKSMWLEDHGTANICFYAKNGDAVAVTASLNLNFGSKVVSESTGIILNNHMDDFAIPGISNAFGFPPTPRQYIEPGKSPTSSMAPTIFVDCLGNVRMLIGGAGGSRILTAISQVIVRHLWFGETFQQAMSASRLHHQLLPNDLVFEDNFDKNIVEGLVAIGHNSTKHIPDGFSTLSGISVDENGYVAAGIDPRRSTSVYLLS